MKINNYKQLFSVAFLSLLLACSTKRDSFVSRNSHALSTEYNILYNGQIALDKGIASIEANSKDNFWERLPIERLQIDDELPIEGKSKNADFELAETKATKAIQKHSMNIHGREKNMQMDEAYLLLGKSRFYDQRFLPALEAFNYILYKYPTSSNIYEAKIWREKVNVRLGNDALAQKNITRFLQDKKTEEQVFADANAVLADAFLHLEEKDSAVAKLKLAENFTKKNPEKARYRFVLGQLYEEAGKTDSAMYFFESVIDMNRKADRKYLMQAQAKKMIHFDHENADLASFLKTTDKLIKDRENRPFLDIIFYNMGAFYDKRKDQKKASEFYNASLRKNSKDDYLMASNYRNLANMSFRNTNYQKAAKYYDSTLVKLDAKTREYLYIQKTRTNLDDVIKYEAIANRNDSILNVISLSNADRVVYFEKHIDTLKKKDEIKRLLEEKRRVKEENILNNSNASDLDSNIAVSSGVPTNTIPPLPSSIPDVVTTSGASIFYFYNPTTVAFGKLEFKKKWGNRAINGNWRLSSNKIDETETDILKEDNVLIDKKDIKEIEVIEKYTAEYYTKQLPKNQIAIDSIAKERNFSYYQLGIIYKEKFKEYGLASTKLEKLLQQNPEEKLVLPAMYNLFKIYQMTNAEKATEIKNKITNQFPNSRYAQIINNLISKDSSLEETPEKEYNKWYKLYQEGYFVSVLEKLDALIDQYSGDEIVSKFELLKANAIGKRYGLLAYKKAMQSVTDNYPNSEEGKKAQDILKTEIPFLEQKSFSKIDNKSWKVVFRIPTQDSKSSLAIETQLINFMTSEDIGKWYYTCDAYTEKERLLIIHGLKSEAYASHVATIFKENKKFKIDENAIVISDENYNTVQIKKNLDEYLILEK